MSSTFKRTRKLASATTVDIAIDTPSAVAVEAVGDTSTSTSSHISTTNQHLPMSGTKFWTHGIVLTSTGLRELDNILLASSGNSTSSSSSSSSSNTSSVGGQPMGTCICIETDDTFLPWSSPLSNCIVRYWCAEGISQDQELVIPIFHEYNANTDHNGFGDVSPWSAIGDTTTCVNDVTNMNMVQELLDSLPRNNNLDVKIRSDLLRKDKSSASTTMTSNNTETWNVPLETLAEEEPYEHDDNDNDDEYYHDNDNDHTTAHTKSSDTDAGLVVAWQYRKDIQDQRLGLTHSHPINSTLDKKRNQPQHGTSASVYCHSYNLQGRLKDQINIDSHVTMVPINSMNENKSVSSSNSRIRNGMKFFQQLISTITTATRKSSSSRNTVVRLLLYHPDMSFTSFVLPLLLHHIRTYKLPVVILVIPHSSYSLTATTSSDRSDLYHVRRCSDVVMCTESFNLRDPNNYPPPSEFRNLHGLLHISRLSTMTQMCTVGHFAERTIQRSPISTRYGLYRDRRKLHISLLHIPPEDYSTDGGSVTKGAVRSGAGRSNSSTSNNIGCSSSGGNGTGPLDF